MKKNLIVVLALVAVAAIAFVVINKKSEQPAVEIPAAVETQAAPAAAPAEATTPAAATEATAPAATK